MEVYEEPSTTWFVGTCAETGGEDFVPMSQNCDVPKLHAFLIPQNKGKSRNLDYCAGSVSDDPTSEYSVFCRGRPTIVPFAIGLKNVWESGDLKLKVQVIYPKVYSKVPVRCSNHKEGDFTQWRDQLMICTDPRAKSLSLEEGYGFMIEPVPQQCDLLFLCRNSCRQGNERDWQLMFSLVDGSGRLLAVRKMYLRVCEVPLRDYIKSSNNIYEWDAGSSTASDPVMRLMNSDGLIDRKPKMRPKPVVSDVRSIYISGREAYKDIINQVAIMEMKRKQEDPILLRLAENMRDWTDETQIFSFLQTICGAETGNMLEKCLRREVRTLRDLRMKYTADFFENMNTPSKLVSDLNSVFLNWRNLIEYYEVASKS